MLFSALDRRWVRRVGVAVEFFIIVPVVLSAAYLSYLVGDQMDLPVGPKANLIPRWLGLTWAWAVEGHLLRSALKPMPSLPSLQAYGGEHESSAASSHRFVHFCARHAASTSDSGRFQTNLRTAFDGETRVALEVRRVVA